MRSKVGRKTWLRTMCRPPNKPTHMTTVTSKMRPLTVRVKARRCGNMDGLWVMSVRAYGHTGRRMKGTRVGARRWPYFAPKGVVKRQEGLRASRSLCQLCQHCQGDQESQCGV